ncbi:hypothetical protein SCLCIDRAFT_25823 [Scleroderma citrinum Foug A]|uniref:Uncharacterized protein n=1 Tax=Scleroderma citrinum Foug A TaxID=1036808 RepID=A0A0C3A9E2_9AGAM|nr:hypothetical protein SCLCIDRAFT_25823 [Scleroderma citrinum Foug A]
MMLVTRLTNNAINGSSIFPELAIWPIDDLLPTATAAHSSRQARPHQHDGIHQTSASSDLACRDALLVVSGFWECTWPSAVLSKKRFGFQVLCIIVSAVAAGNYGLRVNVHEC